MIADLKRAIEQLLSGAKKPCELEGMLAEAKALARKWTIKDSSGREKPLLGDSTVSTSTTMLVALVVALRGDEREHELVKSICHHFPDDFEKLRKATESAEAAAKVSEICSMLNLQLPVPTTKQVYERERSKRLPDIGLIEWEFCGFESEVKKNPLLFNSFFSILSIFPPPTCLDGILARGHINMLRLQELFGLDRRRLTRFVGDNIKKSAEYDYRAVVKIMDGLLREKSVKKHGRAGRTRKLWIATPEVRTHVLAGIEARIYSLPAPKHIRTEFLPVIRRHAPATRVGK